MSAPARSESRSVETYEHALDVLGEVSKRNDSTGFRILPHDETGRPHLRRPGDEDAGVSPGAPVGARPSREGPLFPPRLPPAGKPKLRFTDPSLAGEETEPRDMPGLRREEQVTRPAPAVTPPDEPAEVAVRAGAPRGRPLAGAGFGTRSAWPRQAADRHRQVIMRRVATGGAGAVAVAAVAVAAVVLSGNGGGHHAPNPVTPTTHRRNSASRSKSTTTTTTTQLTSLKPTSVTATDVSFTAPSGHYTLDFQATGGACWIGIQQSVGGPWLFSQTLTPGQSVTYQASGALVVRLGAPSNIGIDVNGLPAQLPSGFKDPYDVELTPPTSA